MKLKIGNHTQQRIPEKNHVFGGVSLREAIKLRPRPGSIDSGIVIKRDAMIGEFRGWETQGQITRQFNMLQLVPKVEIHPLDQQMIPRARNRQTKKRREFAGGYGFFRRENHRLSKMKLKL